VQVFINICVQQFSPWGYKHPLSRIFHNLMVTYLLCESHSGYDLPFMSHRLFPTVFGGAPRHEAHHQRGNVYFHQFFMWIDDALGTVQKEPLPAPLTSHVSELEGSWAGSRVRSPSAARAATAASSANAEAAEGLSQPS
jgi:sterol desaturase/sphingolipid hydroxylase (fatty acid hydroxylase superfamily)